MGAPARFTGRAAWRSRARAPDALRVGVGIVAATLWMACDARVEAQEIERVRFTALLDPPVAGLEDRLAPIARYLESRLGSPFDFVPLEGGTSFIDAFRNDEVQLAWVGSLAGVQARAYVPGARAIAQGRIDRTYRSYFIVNDLAGVPTGSRFPEELRGKTFLFGPEESTSGRLMPEFFIRRYTGRAPAAFFGAPNHYASSPQRTCKLVEEGTYQAGVVDDRTYERMVAEGRLDPQRCQVAWTTPPFPDFHWTAHPSLDERFGAGFVDRLQAALVDMTDPELLKALGRADGLVVAADEDFASILDLAVELELLR